MLHRSNTIYMCPNNSNSNNVSTNENSERVPPIATPLIEMGFSARLVQRAINALGIHTIIFLMIIIILFKLILMSFA